ncbi:hypothetical protein Pla22_47930 [Rubripirellula amarantea]|uniref:Uncharacterized protein n=1 Tax=Rubripirellula amarantea TaxID=2527999 RepID=A0A5C5WFG4_9BACT|nr:hypothetical protein [Rubripirellula amarantea]TWT49596.1 hypothetical protein Pla22_47930 [Rubripirellula amarantea]
MIGRKTRTGRKTFSSLNFSQQADRLAEPEEVISQIARLGGGSRFPTEAAPKTPTTGYGNRGMSVRSLEIKTLEIKTLEIKALEIKTLEIKAL